MKYKEFISLIYKNKLPDKKVYIFWGKEEFLKNKGFQLIKENHKDASLEVKYFCKDNYSGDSFLNEACGVSFFGSKKIIVLGLPTEHSFHGDVKKALDVYINNPSSHTVVIIKSEKFFDISSKMVLHIECEVIREYELPQWITSQVQVSGKSIDRSAVKLLAGYIGNNLAHIEQALNKLFAFAGSRLKIEEKDVSALVDSEIGGDIKKLTAFVRKNQPVFALEELERILAAGESVEKILGFFAWYMKMYPSKTQKDDFNKLLEADKAIKTGTIPGDLALKRLIVQLT